MKKFIYKIIFFILPILIFAYSFDYIISKKIKESRKGDFSVWEDIYNGKINSEIVIYGSSRAVNHINPIILEDKFNTTAYNLGMAGQHVWLQNLRHIEFIKFNKKPKVVIYSLDALLFSDPIGIYQPDQLSPYLFWPERTEIKEHLSVYKYPHFTYFDYYIPLVRYIDSYYTNKIFNLGNDICLSYLNKFLFKKTMKNSIDFDKTSTTNTDKIKIPKERVKGYLPVDLEWNNDLEKALYKNKSLIVAINHKGVLLFEKIITELKRKNIHVIFVYTPEYIEGQKFVKNRNQVIEIFNGISNKYSIPFFNYSQDSISFKKSYFFNSLHLNVKGAEVFSKKFANDLELTLTKALNK